MCILKLMVVVSISYSSTGCDNGMRVYEMDFSIASMNRNLISVFAMSRCSPTLARAPWNFWRILETICETVEICGGQALLGASRPKKRDEDHMEHGFL